MASLTYFIWSNKTYDNVIQTMEYIFSKLNYGLTNPHTGKTHIWTDHGDEILSDSRTWDVLCTFEPSVGVLLWKNKDDLFLSISKSDTSPFGIKCYLTLVGVPRIEQAEIARWLILHAIPEKQEFPDDFQVFQILKI